jgi:hypothetical protein
VKFASTKFEMKMATTTFQQSYTTEYTQSKTTSPWKRFMAFSEGQQENRLLWLGVALAGHGCILTPLTVMAVLLAGTNLFLFVLALVAMGMSLVTNLAAMPTKVTIPIFFLSILIDIAIIISCVVMGFDISQTYI